MAKPSRPLEWLGYQSNPAQTPVDLRSMSITELEAIAGNTVVAMLKAAHAREAEAESKAQQMMAEAMAEADRVRTEAETYAAATTGAAQKSATTLVQSANESAEATLKNAERQSADIVADANKQADDIVTRAHAESTRIRSEWEKNVKTSTAQMQAALTRFSGGVQSQLQLARQISLKSNAIESELVTARDAIAELSSTLLGESGMQPSQDS
jgi:F0F1-type ATP synthase membrane subunit b/b'